MSVLSHDRLIEYINDKKITITNDFRPFNSNQVKTAGIDLTLSNEFRIYSDTKDIIDLKDGIDYKKYTTPYISDNGYILKPYETILGITEENVSLSDNICAILNGRSSFARMGLCIHITAFFINPGVDNRTVLEIHNESPLTLHLIPGQRICQMIFLHLDGNSSYNGKFQQQIL